MNFAEQKKEYAVVLSDAQHQVEMGLYRLPSDAESLTSVLEQLNALPHTPEERTQILSRIYQHLTANEIEIPEADLETLKSAATEESSEEPVEIALDEKNYGLVYSAVQFALESMAPATQVTEDDSTEAEVLKRSRFCEAIDERIKVHVAEIKATLLDAMKEQQSQVEMTPEAIEELASKLNHKLTSTEATEALQTQLDEALEAVHTLTTEMVAALMVELRKPLTRGKSFEDVVEALKSRSSDSLADTLTDLRMEKASGGGGALTNTRLEDPTQPSESEEGEEPGEPDVQNIGEVDAEEVSAGELPMDEDDDVIRILFPNLK
jgi:hypothetical protein